MQAILAVVMGLSLAAATGFRVFLPITIASMAVVSGHLEPGPGLAWLGSPFLLGVLVVATFCEIGAYYVPWLDNLLDVVSAPAAAVAGTLVAASFLGDLSAPMRWSLAIIAGGGAAGGISTLTSVVRAASTATTGGLANPVVSTLEWFLAALVSLMAIVAPFVALLGLAALTVWMVRKLADLRRRSAQAPALRQIS